MDIYRISVVLFVQILVKQLLLNQYQTLFNTQRLIVPMGAGSQKSLEIEIEDHSSTTEVKSLGVVTHPVFILILMYIFIKTNSSFWELTATKFIYCSYESGSSYWWKNETSFVCLNHKLLDEFEFVENTAQNRVSYIDDNRLDFSSIQHWGS